MSARLDIDSLRALKAISDHGGVTRAAQRLSLSQSAVSHKIRRLEDSIACPLLSRRAGAGPFTDAGVRLLAYAERIVALHDEAVDALETRSLVGRIRLGITEDTTSSGLARILSRFAQLHPNVQVRTHVAQSLVLERQLEEGEIDLAVLQVFDRDSATSDKQLFRERLHWVTSPDRAIDLSEPVPFLVFDEDCFYRRWAFEMAKSATWQLRTVLQCASAAGIATAVEAGMGVALLNQRRITRAMHVVDEWFISPPDVAHIVRTGRKTRDSAVFALVDAIDTEATELALSSATR